jgi:hypothetical protein
MNSLDHWFRKNAEKPLISVTLVVIALAALQFFSSYQSLRKSQEQGLRQMTDLVVLALNQKNQILLESILEASRWQLSASKAELCLGTKSILASTQGLGLCGKENTSIFSR